MTRGRPRSFDRDEALDAAVTLFWEHGYDATSIAMLTAALGIGAPSLYKAFGDKGALFREALERYLRTYADFIPRALAQPNVRTAVMHLLRDAAASYTRPDRPPGCLLITAATNCSPQSADIAASLRHMRNVGIQALAAKIDAAKKTGEVSPDTDAHALASFFAATLQGMSAQARDGADREDLDAISAIALSTWPPGHGHQAPEPS